MRTQKEEVVVKPKKVGPQIILRGKLKKGDLKERAARAVTRGVRPTISFAKDIS